MKAIYGKVRKAWFSTAHADYETIETPEEELKASAAITEQAAVEVPHAEPGAIQAVKTAIKGHGEQAVLPDDCEFGDNDLCYVET